MKRLILTMVSMCVPMAALAQQPDSRVAIEGVVLSTAAAASPANATAMQAGRAF